MVEFCRQAHAIMQCVRKLTKKFPDGVMVSAVPDSGTQNAVLLRFVRYGEGRNVTGTYRMRARLDAGRVIYEDIETGQNARDSYIERGLLPEDYDAIMTIRKPSKPRR